MSQLANLARRTEMTTSKVPAARTTRAAWVKWTAIIGTAASLIAGCGDSHAQAEKKDATKGIAAPSIAETRTIAEEGFIYGLPIVMNYAVMYAYSVDKNSGQ